MLDGEVLVCSGCLLCSLCTACTAYQCFLLASTLNCSGKPLPNLCAWCEQHTTRFSAIDTVRISTVLIKEERREGRCKGRCRLDKR